MAMGYRKLRFEVNVVSELDSKFRKDSRFLTIHNVNASGN